MRRRLRAPWQPHGGPRTDLGATRRCAHVSLHGCSPQWISCIFLAQRSHAVDLRATACDHASHGKPLSVLQLYAVP